MAARANVILPSGKATDIDPKNWPELRRRAAADKRYGGRMPTFASKEDAELVVEALNAEPEDAATAAQDLVRGVRQGASGTFADEGSAAVGASLAEAKGEDYGENYERLRDYERAENKRSDDRSPYLTGAGKVIGAAPATVAAILSGTGGAAATGVGGVGRALAPLAGTVSQEVLKRTAPYIGAAAAGGLTALGSSESTKPDDINRDIVEGAGSGVVAQGVGSVVANPLARLALDPKGAARAAKDTATKYARKVPEGALDALDALVNPGKTVGRMRDWVRAQKAEAHVPLSTKSQLPENTGSMTSPDRTDPLASPKERAAKTERDTLDAIARGRAESRVPEDTDPNHPRIAPLAESTRSGTPTALEPTGSRTEPEVPRAKGRPTSAADRKRALKELRRAAQDDPDRTASMTPTPTAKGPRDRGTPPETTSPDRLAQGSEEPAFKTVPRDAELERVEKQPGFKPAGREERELPGVRRDKYDPTEPRPVKTDYRKYAEEKHAKIDAFDKITDENARAGDVLPKPGDPLGELTGPPKALKPRTPRANKQLETLLAEALELVPPAQRDAFSQYARGLPPKQAIAQMKDAIAKTRAQRGLPPSTKEPKTPPEEPDPAPVVKLEGVKASKAKEKPADPPEPKAKVLDAKERIAPKRQSADEGRHAIETLRALDDDTRVGKYDGPHTGVRKSWDSYLAREAARGVSEADALAAAWDEGGLRQWLIRSGPQRFSPKQKPAPVVDMKAPTKKTGEKPDALSELERPPARVLDATKRFPDESSKALMERAQEVGDTGKPTERAIEASLRLRYLRGLETKTGKTAGPFEPSEDAHDLSRRWSDQDANAWVQKAQRAKPDDVTEMQAALDAGDESPMRKWNQLSDSDPQGAAWKLLTSGWRFEKGRWVLKKK